MNSKLVVIFFTAIFCLFLAPIPLVRAEFAHNHIYKISGTVTYENQPYAGKTVQLYEHDGWPNPDDHMGEAVTDQEGKFVINGSQDEENPEPYLYISNLPRTEPLVIPELYVWLEPETVQQSVFIQLELDETKISATVNGRPAKTTLGHEQLNPGH